MTLDDFKRRYRLAPPQPGDGGAVNDHGNEEPGDYKFDRGHDGPCIDVDTGRTLAKREPLTPGAPPLTSVCSWCVDLGDVETPPGTPQGLCERHATAMRRESAALLAGRCGDGGTGERLASALCRCGHVRARHVHYSGPGGRLCFPREEMCACTGFRAAGRGVEAAE